MRGSAPIPILLILTIAVLGFFIIPKIITNQNKITSPSAILNSTPDPYPGWKTYKNSTLSFTIRYPRNWFVKEYQDYAAHFYDTEPNEATPGAIKVKFLSSQEKVDIAEFEKIAKLNPGQEIREPLDVKSIITKTSNLKVGDYQGIEYDINRNFTAPQGPRTEYRHIYEIKKDETILEFISTDQTKEAQQIFDPIFQQIISSIKF